MQRRTIRMADILIVADVSADSPQLILSPMVPFLGETNYADE